MKAMIPMKHLYKLISGLLTLFILAGCQLTPPTEGATDSGLSIVATTSMIADLANRVGGEHVTVTGLMGPGVDPHDYQPSTSDVIKMGEADVVIYNGLSLEERFVEVFDSLGERGVLSIVVADGISEQDYRDPDEEDDLEYDPHIWFSVPHWQEGTQHVADQLSEKDPENASAYQQNAEAYIEELEELDAYIRERIEEVPEQSRYLVTAHDAFQYFGAEYGFDVVGLQGLNTQTEAGTGDISRLADFLVEKEINAVFVESSVSPRNIEALIEAAGSRGHEVTNAGELYSDALGSAEDNAETYIKMYTSNIDTIVDALKD